MTAVLAYFCLEVGLNVFDYMARRHEPANSKLLLTPYLSKDWASTHFEEFKQVPENYEPFVGWARREYHGKTINVDAQGVRKSWNPATFSQGQPKTVYAFGGSTLWGTGARDDYTIPSLLSKRLNRDGAAFDVSNYGETGYTFLQEVIRLALLLREGHRPDYVIFYDGGNDVYAAYQAGKVETTQNCTIIREKLQRRPAQQVKLWLKNVLTRYSRVYEALGRLREHFSPKQRFQEAACQWNESQLKTLSGGIVESYKKSMDLVDRLSKAYGFQYLCFWQPVIFTETHLTEEETRVSPRLDDRALTLLYRNVNEALKDQSLPRFHNISDALNQRTKTYYIDFCHLSEEGNAAVAEAISKFFEDQFLEKKPQSK